MATIGDLIKRLEELDPDLPIVVAIDDGCAYLTDLDWQVVEVDYRTNTLGESEPWGMCLHGPDCPKARLVAYF